MTTNAEDRSYDSAPGQRASHGWGYEDTQFEFCGAKTVRLTGHRYPLAGPPMPRFVPFVEEILGLSLEPELLREPAPPRDLPAPVRHREFLAELNNAFSPKQLEEGDEARLIHSHGQLSVEEVFRILQGQAPARLVDLVVYPESDRDVVKLVRLADRYDVVLIPYGGGTNVSGALLCPADETRMVVSVDMARMNRIVEVDRENNWAVVEAGITGKDLELQLAQEGLTCGHEPDSIEFSTLGGWIATNASGMKKNRYGNIEEIVVEAEMVTASGEIKTAPVCPRSSIGIQSRNFLFGCEGTLGIITRAVIQVRAVPEVRKYASCIFRDFSAGIAFLKAVQAAGIRPASIRLVNNREFRLGRALSPAGSGWKHFLSGLQTRYVRDVKGFDPEKMAACTVLMEGHAAEVRQQEQELLRLLRDAGGLAGGSEGGKRGYRATFAIAYIRDFLNKLGVIGETFETSAPWNRIEAITTGVENELYRLCEAHGVPGRPYLSYRISQSYQTGVCIYFTMGFFGRRLAAPEQTYQKIEHRLREVILEQGGSLSHHHGVGKLRRDFMTQVHSPGSIEALRALKAALDPRNIFAAGNNVFHPDSAARGGSVRVVGEAVSGSKP